MASTYGPIPLAFWDKISDIDLSQEPNAPRVPGSGPQFARIFERAYECLGSTDNDEVFMLVQYQVKDVKNFVDHRSLSPILSLLAPYPHFNFLARTLALGIPRCF